MDLLISLFKEVFYLSAMASVLVLMLLVLKRVFHKALRPKWHYYLWVVLILRLVLPFQPPSSLSIYTLFYNAAESANLPIAAAVEPFLNTPPGQESTTYDDGTTITASNQADTTPMGFGTGPTQNSVSAGSIHNSGVSSPDKSPIDFIEVAAVVWLGGMLLLSLYTVAINVAFASDVRRRYAPLRNERIERLLTNCKVTLHIEREILIFTAGKARTPALYGLRRPKILISEASMQQLSDGEISHVFLHELSHFKRKDIAVNWLMTVLQIVYFFNPLVWYAFYKIREDCEIACDADALTYLAPEDRQMYGGTIIKLIRLFSESNFIPVTAGILKNKSSIKRRIRMIGSFKKNKWTGTLLAVIIIAATALAGLSGCSNTAGEITPDNSPVNPVSSSPTADVPSPDVSIKPSDGNTEAPTPAITENTNPSENPSPSAEPMPSQEPGVTAAPMPSQAPAPSEAPSPVPASPSVTAEAANGYYGQWTINKVLAYGDVGTYSKADAEKLIGINLSFSTTNASIINDQPSDKAIAIKNPVYHEGSITKTDFLTNFKMSFLKLGITADSITQVDVSSSDSGGCVLLIKDSNTLILVAGGTYFELTRA